MRKTITALGAAAVLATGAAAATPALAAPVAHSSPAPPVKVNVNGPLILHNYAIESVGYPGYYMTPPSAPVGRMGLSSSEWIVYEQTATEPYSYEGVLWYQWKDSLSGYCMQAVGSGNAYVEETTCNGTNQAQFFYNNALSNSEFLSLSSTVYEGKNFGADAESNAAFSVNSYSNVAKYHWNFVSS